MKYKEFKNGNINCKFEEADFENAKSESDIIALLWALESHDTYLISDEFCISNYAMGCEFYNVRIGCTYILNFNQLDELMQSKTIKLYANFDIENDENVKEFLNE